MRPWFDFCFWLCICCLLVYIVCFPTYLFSSLFSYLSPPLLIFPFENRPAPFPGCPARRLNLALVFFRLFCVVVHFFWLLNACYSCVRFNFYFLPSQAIGSGKRLRNDLFCVKWDMKQQLCQSVSWRQCELAELHAGMDSGAWTWNWVTFCDPVTWESSDPETQLTLFYNELDLCCRQTFAMGKRFAGFYRCLAFACFWEVKFWRSFIKCQYFSDGWTDVHKNIYLYLGLFFENRKNSGLTPGQNDDLVTRTWKMTHWPGDPMTQFHVWDSLQCGACSIPCLWVRRYMVLYFWQWSVAVLSELCACRLL